ncbi:MAG TPA: PD-(D/E)XK nuclease family protein [Polyangiaceae bacterium]
MHPLVGLEFSGATLTPFDDFAPGQGALGRPVWGPEEFLRDLELRLGLGDGADSPGSVRTAQWAARMDVVMAGKVAGGERFYSASFAVDRLGTAQAVLELRDGLVSAGWDGGVVADGGPRLEAIAELEELGDIAVPPGIGDRVLAAAKALERRALGTPLYDGVTFAESAVCWSGVWNRACRAMSGSGTELSQLTVALPGAPPETDLGKVQAALNARGEGGGEWRSGERLTGDGTFILVTAETSFEAAEGAAALLRDGSAGESVVIREDDQSALDHALRIQQSPTLGLSPASRWRPALQLLPLALELAFEPKDPFRVLELLNLPQGPFTGRAGRRLSRALARSPGIGGRAWEEAKARLAEPREEALRRIADWLETPGADPVLGAPKADLLRLIDRVRGYVTSQIAKDQIAKDPTDLTLFAAIEQADAMAAALKADGRERFDLVSARRLSEFALGPGARIELLAEAAGRIAHVSTAQALWVPRQTVLWWPFCASAGRRVTRGWRRHELVALQRAGLLVSQTGLLERQQWTGWRRAVSAATGRLVLVAPRHMAGQAQRLHPLWDEIVARLKIDETAQARLTRSVDSLLTATDLAVEQLESLALPAAPLIWEVALSEAPRFSPYSAGSLSALLACPLRWALGALAGLESEDPGLPPPHLLAGTLGHRLIEELVLAGAFAGADADGVAIEDESEFRARAERTVDLLIEREGALLLRPGKAHERAQRRQQFLAAALALRQVLDSNSLSVLAVERTFEVPWRDAHLTGRWDLLVQRACGSRGVIDVKWGHSGYQKLLELGAALQLASYVKALEVLEGAEAFAGYFSLTSRRFFGPSGVALEGMATVRGPCLSDTWRRIERTLPLVQARVAGGRLDVTGISDAPPLLDTVGVPKARQTDHFSTAPAEICKYCRFDGVCGKRWEQQR